MKPDSVEKHLSPLSVHPLTGGNLKGNRPEILLATAGAKNFCRRFFPRLLFCCLAILFSLPATVVTAATAQSPGWQPAHEQNTIFLPLKVIAKDSVALTPLVDQKFKAALESKQQISYPRATATTQLDYQAAWPPKLAAVRGLTTNPAISYISAGTITQVGRRLSIDVVVYNLADGREKFFFKAAESVNALADAARQLTGEILAYTGRYLQVSRVTVKGNKRIDSGAILRQCKSNAGNRFDPHVLRRDIKAIFKLGYFDDVRVEVADSPNGKAITFIVREKDIIGRIDIVGNDEVKEKDIRDVLAISANTIINPRDVQKSIANIRRLYKEKGYYNTEATAAVDQGRKGVVNVRFTIKEGTKVYIKEIKVVGNNAFADKKIKKIIETSEHGILSWLTDSGVLKRDIVEQDTARIAAFYHNHGFVDAKVGKPEIRQQGKWLYVTFTISEGERYRVSKVSLQGELIDDPATLLNLTKLRSEPFFSRKTLREDIIRLTDYYAEHGFAYAEITPAIDKNEEQRTIAITISIRKHELVHVNRIIIRGNSRTRDKVIRREIRLKEREIFDATALKNSHAALMRLGFFEDIDITPEPAASDELMDVKVTVTEKPTGTFSIGAGYSSIDDFMFTGEISENNFLGRGQRLALQANLSGTSNRYNLSFTEPHLSDTDLLFGIDLYSWDREYDDYTKESQGLGLRFGYPIWERWHMLWSYGYDDTSLTDVDLANAATAILDSLDINITSFIKLGFVRDTRDRPLNPGKGSRHSIETKYAGGPALGGDSSFTKINASTSWYFPFLFNTTLHLRGAAGYVTENRDGKLPIYEHFYLGGMQSIRGFKNGQISPKDPQTGDRIGGDKMWFYNSEIIFPLLKDAGLNGVVFLDAGNVYDFGESWDFSILKRSAGAGVRWLSPMGPLRLEWGYNLDPVGDEDQSNWDFSIGGAF